MKEFDQEKLIAGFLVAATVLVAQGHSNRCDNKADIELYNKHNHSIYKCWPSSDCHDGQELSVVPGSSHPDGTDISCQDCHRNYFSNNITNKRCRKCTSCGNKEELFPCTSVRDGECASRCISNEFYFNATDEQCYPCTECCVGEDINIEPQCITMRMGTVIGGKGERHCSRSSKPCEELPKKNLSCTCCSCSSNCNCTMSCNCSLSKIIDTRNCSLSSNVSEIERELPNQNLSKPGTVERECPDHSIDGVHIALFCLLALCVAVILCLGWLAWKRRKRSSLNDNLSSSENCRLLCLSNLIPGSSTCAERTPCLNSCYERLNVIPEEIKIDKLPFEVEEKLVKKLDAKKPHLRNWWHVGRKIGVPQLDLDTCKREEDREGGSPTTLLLSYLSISENVLSLKEFVDVIHCLGRHDICSAICELFQTRTSTV